MKIVLSCITIVLGTALPVVAQELPAEPGIQATVPAPVDPEVAASHVTEALKEAKGVPAQDISVATHASTVLLTGEVDTEAQRAAAQSVAQKAAGGLRISNDVEVKAPEDRTPKVQRALQKSTQLVQDVEAALKGDARTVNFGIVVLSTDPDTIVLQGLVPTHEIRTAAENVVSKVKGVNQVDNRLLTP